MDRIILKHLQYWIPNNPCSDRWFTDIVKYQCALWLCFLPPSLMCCCPRCWRIFRLEGDVLLRFFHSYPTFPRIHTFNYLFILMKFLMLQWEKVRLFTSQCMQLILELLAISLRFLRLKFSFWRVRGELKLLSHLLPVYSISVFGRGAEIWLRQSVYIGKNTEPKKKNPE